MVGFHYTPPAIATVLSERLPLELSTADALLFPPELYFSGDLSLLDPAIPRVAVIGIRKPSEEGKLRARRLIRELVSRGVCIVSGLADGVDTVAHESAIEFGGRTIAVVGLPLDRCYPPEELGVAGANRSRSLAGQPVLTGSTHSPLVFCPA